MPDTKHRRLDYYFRFPFEKTDTAIYKLPVGFVADVLPPAFQLSSELATYSTKTWYNEAERAIYCVSQLILLNHVIPAAKFDAVKKFFFDAGKDDQQHIVIKKM